MKCTTRFVCAMALGLGSTMVSVEANATAPAPKLVTVEKPAVATPAYPADVKDFRIVVNPIKKNEFGKNLANVCATLSTVKEGLLPSDKAFDESELDKQIADVAKEQDDTKKTSTAENILPHLYHIKESCELLADSSKWKDLPDKLRILAGLRDAQNFAALADALDRNSKVNAATTANALATAFALKIERTKLGGGYAGVEGGASFVGAIGDKFVNGLADFLVTRAKQEAILYLQEQVHTTLCVEQAGTSGKLLPRELMPNTCNTFATLDTGLSLNAMGTHLHSAAKMDLVLLPDSTLRAATKLDPKHHYFYEPGRLMYAVARKVEQGGYHPLDVLASIHAMEKRKCEEDAGDTPEGKACKAVFQSIKLGSNFLYTFQSLDSTSVQALLAKNDDMEKRAHLVAFLLNFDARAKVLKMITDEHLSKKAMEILSDSVNVLREVQTAIEALNKAPEGDANEADDQRRRRLARASLDATVAMIRLTETLSPVFGIETSSLKEVLETLELSAKLGQASLEHDYGAISVNTTALVNEIKKLLPEKPETPGYEDGRVIAKVLDLVSKYTPLVVEIASAKTSKDVATAFEAAAAPVGSYRVKFDRPTIALNAFVGGAFSKEWLLADEVTGAGWTGGGFAPVGVHITKPGSLGGCKMNVGMMFSLIDVGSLTQYKLSKEIEVEQDTAATADVKAEVSQTATIGWEQFLAPGFYLTWSPFAKAPFVFGGGASVVPNLRRVELTDEAKTSFDSPVVRLGGFLALDLTLLPFN